MSNFRMFPVPESKLDLLLPIITRFIEGLSGLPYTLDAEHFIENVKRGYLYRIIDAYVDNVENPQHILVLTHGPSIWSKETITTVLSFYSLPESRAQPLAVKAMFDLIDNYARIHSSCAVVGASVDFGDNTCIEKLWLRKNYTALQTSFVKKLL